MGILFLLGKCFFRGDGIVWLSFSKIKKFRTRLRAADNRLTAAAAASIALRASENSPLTRSSKLIDSTTGSGGTLLLIEQQKQQDVCFKYI